MPVSIEGIVLCPDGPLFVGCWSDGKPKSAPLPAVNNGHGPPAHPRPLMAMSTDLEAHVGNRTRRLMEMTMALAILALGVQLTLTPDEVFRPDGALAMLLLFASPLVWTLFFTMLGTARLVVVIINGVWRPSPIVRQAMSVLSLGGWSVLAMGYWMALPATKGFPALVLTVVCFIVEANCLYALSALRASRGRGT